MKKFNSILAIAAVALTSVFGFTSCDKNDDDINQAFVPTTPQTPENPQSPEKTESTYEYTLFVSNEMLKLGDVVVTLDNNGQKTEYKASDAETCNRTVKNNDYDNPQTLNISGRMVRISGIHTGSSVTPVFMADKAAIDALPSDGNTTCGFALNIYVNSSLGKSTYKSSNFGIDTESNTTVENYITHTMSVFTYTFTR